LRIPRGQPPQNREGANMSHSTGPTLRTWTAVAVVALLTLCLQGCPPATTWTLQFVNNTSHSCMAFYAVPATDTTWGSNVFSSWLASGNSRNVTNMPTSTLYDFRALFNSGHEATLLNQAYGAGETRSWTVTDGDLQPYTPSQTILDLEQSAFDAVNSERTSQGRSALTMRSDMRLVARMHGEDMAANGFFDHDNLAGQTPWDRLAAASITYFKAGENIAWSDHSSPVTSVVAGWMGSTGHRDSILDTEFTHTGMGVAVSASGRYYFTQVFIDAVKSGGDLGDLTFVTFSVPEDIVRTDG